MSEFFMYDSDPMKLKTYKRAKDLFYEYNADRIKENGITVGSVPYAGGYLPVMVCKCSKDCRGRILLHGGNDSYIEEFFEAMLYLKEKGFAGIFNGFYRKMMDKSELVRWNLMHGMYAYDAPDPVGYVKKIRNFTLKGIADRITQDILIIGGRDDHMIMPHLFKEEYDLLTNVRSLTFSLYSDKDDAGSHCGIGNMKLILDTMVSWTEQMKSKNS